MKSSAGSALIIFFTLFISGCATTFNPATGRKEFIIIDSAAEVSIGQRVIPDFERKNLRSSDPLLQARLERIGRNIALVSDRRDIDYRFRVLEDEELNALTLPGGYIYVNKGLMNVFSDDELAYVLAHEVGHVAARHIAKKMQSGMAYQLILGIAVTSMGPDTYERSQNIAQGLDAVYSLVELSYSRKDEFEADRLALKYARLAGYSPYASLAALNKLRQKEGGGWKLMRYFRTHPYVDERISAIQKILQESG